MAGTLTPTPSQQFFDDDGAPANAYQVFFYESGTLNKEDAFTDAALSVAWTNPIVLPADGRATIYLDPSITYRVILAPPNDTDPPASPVWDVDPVNPVPEGETANVDIEGVAGENVSAGDILYVSQGDGGRTDGRWYLGDATNDYSSLTAATVGFAQTTSLAGATVTIRIAGTQTDSGLNPGDVYYIDSTPGGITNVLPANARIVGVAQSATSLVIGINVSQFASATSAGIVSTTTQSFAGDKTLLGALTNSSTTPAVFYVAPSFYPGLSQASGGSAIRVGGRVTSTVTSVASSTGGNVDIINTTLPANFMNADGAVLTWRGSGTFLNNGNTKTITVTIGATTFNVVNNAINNQTWSATVDITRFTSATGRISNQVVISGATNQITGGTGTTDDFTTALAFIVRLPTSTANSDVVCLRSVLSIMD